MLSKEKIVPEAVFAAQTEQELGSDSGDNELYKPLKSDTDDFRLLRVHLREADGAKPVLSGRLKTFSARPTDTPKYHALSYTWDYASEWVEMSINGQDFRVRQSLYDFLVLYQRRHPNGCIWIDQICIDQDSTYEKNHQVSRMALIYSCAIKVIIWLSAPRTVATLRKAALLRRRHLPRKLLDELHAFEAHPYWRRTWVVQEVLLARSLEIYWGKQTIEWERLCGGLPLRYVDFFVSWARPKKIAPSFDMAQILDHIKSTDCDDPRDKWYSIRGLFPDEYTTPVDYRKSIVDVFSDAAIAIMLESVNWLFLLDVFTLATAMHLTSTPIEDDHLVDTEMDAAVLGSINDAIRRGNRHLEWRVRGEFKRAIATTRGTWSAPLFSELYLLCGKHIQKDWQGGSSRLRRRETFDADSFLLDTLPLRRLRTGEDLEAKREHEATKEHEASTLEDPKSSRATYPFGFDDLGWDPHDSYFPSPEGLDMWTPSLPAEHVTWRTSQRVTALQERVRNQRQPDLARKRDEKRIFTSAKAGKYLAQ